MDCSTPGSSVLCYLRSLLKFMSISLWCYLTISSSAAFLILPLIFPSIRVFSNELALHIRWPKYWNFNFSISLSNEYSGLIFFRINWFDLLAVQVTLKSLLQHHNSKASILQRSAFIMVQLYIHRWLMEKNHTFDFPNMPAEHCGDFWKEFLGWSSHMASIRMPDLLPRILWASGMLTFLPHPGLVCLKHK